MDSYLNKRIGKILKSLRESKSLTRKELSAKFNVSEGALEKWESGEREISTENLLIIAKYFNVDIDYLYGIESGEDGKPQFTGYKNIGKRLRQRREELGYSRSELLENLSCNIIENIELNNDLCDFKTFMEIAAKLKMSFEELIYGTETVKFVENEFTKKRESELVFDGIIDAELLGGCDSPEFVDHLIKKYCIKPREYLIEMYKAGEYSKIRQYLTDSKYYDEHLAELNTIKDKDLLEILLCNHIPMPPCHGIEINDYNFHFSRYSCRKPGYEERLRYEKQCQKCYEERLIGKRREILFNSVKAMYDGFSLNKAYTEELEECYNKKLYTDVQWVLYKKLCYKLYWFFEGKLEWFENETYNLKEKYSWFNGSVLDLYEKFSSIKSIPKEVDTYLRYLLQVTRDQNCDLTEEQLKTCDKFIKNISAFY